MNLRPYQQKCHDDLIRWFHVNPSGHPIVSAATGSGKSHLIAHLVEQAITTWPNQRIIMLTHSRELVKQNVEKLLNLWPDAPVGILSGGLGSHHYDAPIVFGTIGTAAKYADKIGYSTLGIVDECHRVDVKQQGQYRKFIDRMQAYNRRFRVVGYTATPFRGNGQWLHSGPEVLFTDIAATVSMRKLLDDKYLSPLVNAPTKAIIDTSGVGTAAGDYKLGELAAAADQEAITRAAVGEILRHAVEQDRRHALVFAVTIAHAEHIVAEFKMHYEKSVELVTGKTKQSRRDELLERFKAGDLKYLVNVGVATTGFDAPCVDLIALLRPTRSPVLAVQMAGRGTRIDEGKTDCLFIDFTSTLEQLGPIDLIKGRPYRKPQEDTEAPHCLCPECGAKNPPSADRCALCGAEIIHEEKASHQSEASDAPVLSTSGGKLHQVGSVSYHRHKKSGSPDSVCVSYWSGNGGLLDHTPIAREWVCIEHPEGYAKNKALLWLRRRHKNIEKEHLGSADVDEIIWLSKRDALLEPIAITVAKRGRYNEITGAIFP